MYKHVIQRACLGQRIEDIVGEQVNPPHSHHRYSIVFMLYLYMATFHRSPYTTTPIAQNSNPKLKRIDPKSPSYKRTRKLRNDGITLRTR